MTSRSVTVCARVVMRTTANCHLAEGKPTTARRDGVPVPATRSSRILPDPAAHSTSARRRGSRARPHGTAGVTSTPVRYGDGATCPRTTEKCGWTVAAVGGGVGGGGGDTC